MKFHLFCLVLFSFSISGRCQFNKDSIEIANQWMDIQIANSLSQLDSMGFHFIILRTYDSLNVENNQCNILSAQDSCSGMYTLKMDYNYKIHTIHVGDVKAAYSDGCSRLLNKVVKEINLFENKYTESTMPIVEWSKERNLLISKNDGKYLKVNYDLEENIDDGISPWSVVCYHLRYGCK
ncbi:hypothetical protein K6119_00405 [Paracrocinitomix mangrovi]|uniref:hypothetical protein n=1 Tax=Paracrocinitomix mangrovi TaxID=2862509 RepID=UPI001C8D4045|nr:hypothetical protein [Paracrocinitomix mangrovi]UKN01975.1 hypothetical protein K6119_00405 [Paracrocinitomix mangrovi]